MAALDPLKIVPQNIILTLQKDKAPYCYMFSICWHSFKNLIFIIDIDIFNYEGASE